jgi:DNA polymerase-1
MKVIGSWNKEKVLNMGCWDVITTFKVMEKQLPLMTDKEKDLQQTLLIPLIEVFEHMERKGLNVNINTLAGLYAKGFPEVEALNQEIQDEIGINPGSPKQICQYFNLNDSQEDTLAYHIKRDHVHSRLFQKILDFRGKQKALSTYLKGIYERLEDNRIHTEYKIEGTGTGRPSSSNPNLANVPKELRVIYIPDSPDYIFIEVDKSQLELRVGALIAPEPTLLDELSQGADIHERTRLSILDAYPGFAAFGSRQRLITKSVVFGTFYGRTAMSIAREFGIPVAIAEKIQAVCINKYKGFHEYKTRCERAVAKDGLLTTAFGRRRIVNTLNQGYNTPVQSAAADVGLTTLLNLFKAGLDLRITVYDSYLIQVPKHKAKEYQEEIINIAQLPFDIFNGYSFPVKAKQGSDWYNLKEVVYA